MAGGRWIKRGALALVALAAALGGAELWLRRSWPVLSSTYRLDEELLFTTIPNTRRIQPMARRAGGARNLVRLNSLGYRGPELDEPKARPRIVVAGDSQVLAANVAEAETLPVRLEERLGGRFELVNAGVEGYGPDQTLLRLSGELDVLDPDLVLLVLCAHNDMGDLLRNKLFRLDGRQLVRQHPIVGEREVAIFAHHHARSRWPALRRAWTFLLESRAAARQERLEDESEAPDWVAQCLQAAAWEYETAVVERQLVVENLRQDTYDADVAVHPDGESARYKRDLLAAVLRRLEEVCTARAVPLAALIVPSPADMDPAFRVQVDRERFPSYQPQNLTDACAEALELAGIPHLDLFATFAANEPGTLFVGWDDIHWNAKGIALGARETARWLEEAGLLPQL